THMRRAIALATLLALGSFPAVADGTATAPTALTASALEDTLIPAGARNVAKLPTDEGWAVNFKSEKSVGDLIDFLRPKLEQAGWRFTSDDRVGRQRMCLLNKAEHGEGMIMFSPDKDGDTLVLVMLKD